MCDFNLRIWAFWAFFNWIRLVMMSIEKFLWISWPNFCCLLNALESLLRSSGDVPVNRAPAFLTSVELQTLVRTEMMWILSESFQSFQCAMYPSAYYTYNPSRMKKADKAYFKHGRPKIWILTCCSKELDTCNCIQCFRFCCSCENSKTRLLLSLVCYPFLSAILPISASNRHNFQSIFFRKRLM